MQIKIPSFKYKMILFSFVLVGTCLGTFLYYIINYFQTDKRAYLYEEAFRFGIEANSALERSAVFGKLIAKTIKPSGFNFKDLQDNLIAVRMETADGASKFPWSYNKSFLKELELPETDFLGNYEESTNVSFLPTSEMKNGYFKIFHREPDYRSILAIYPKDFFELLNSRKFANVSIIDNKTKNIVFKSPNFPTEIDPTSFDLSNDQTRSFEKTIEGRNYFITTHKSPTTGTSTVILYNMDSANATLAVLSKTLIWAAVGMFGFGLIISTFFANSLSRPLELLADMSRKISLGELSTRVSIKNSDETGILASSFNNMMDKIQTFIEELKGKARLESELKLASLVQRNFFDLNPMNTSSFNLRGDYISASECAGDWWAVRKWNGKYILLLGDATGHGAPSALLTSAVFSAVECIQGEVVKQDQWWTRPDEVLKRLNQVVISLSKDLMMTFVVGFYDPMTNKIWLANASHEAPVLYNLQRLPTTVSDFQFLMTDPGPRLGDQTNPNYAVSEIQLHEDDRIIFYTDGLIESLVEPGKKYSERFFLKRLLQIGDKNVEQTVKELPHIPADGHPNDDISFFIMDIKSKKESKDFMHKITIEKDFLKSPKQSDNGFMVGEVDQNLKNKMTQEIFTDWENALEVHNERARSPRFMDYINSFGSIRGTVKERLFFALDELIMNGESHGQSAGKVLIKIERAEKGFWVKSKDFGGNFNESSVVKLYESIFDETLTPSETGASAGIGLGMIIKMSDHFQIYVNPKKETIVSCFIPDKSPDRLGSFAYIKDSQSV